MLSFAEPTSSTFALKLYRKVSFCGRFCLASITSIEPTCLLRKRIIRKRIKTIFYYGRAGGHLGEKRPPWNGGGTWGIRNETCNAGSRRKQPNVATVNISFRRSFTETLERTRIVINKVTHHPANHIARFFADVPGGAAILRWAFFQDGRCLSRWYKSILFAF